MKATRMVPIEQPAPQHQFWNKILRQRVSNGTRYDALYGCDAFGRIRLLKAGVPAALLKVIAEDMAISQETLFATVGVSRATVHRKLQSGARLSQDESERVLSLARLIGQADAIVRASGDPEDFDAPKWVATWIAAPHPALGGKRPADFMDTADGRALVSDLIARMQSASYS